MNYRSLAFTVAAFSSLHVASANAQSVYVAPGGVYIGAGPVYVIPAGNRLGPCVAPTNGYECGPPVVVAPPVAPTGAYWPNGGYYGEPDGAYEGEPNGVYYGAPNGAYYGASIRAPQGVRALAYAGERVRRPLVGLPYPRAVAHRAADPTTVASRSSPKRSAGEAAVPPPLSRPRVHPDRNVSGRLAEAPQIAVSRQRPSAGR